MNFYIFRIVSVLSVLIVQSASYHGQQTRLIRIKQGALKGIVSDPLTNPNLRPVEQFLGIPYASPPIGEMRFMPPGSAPPWTGLKIFDQFGPACPQNIPNIDTDDKLSIFRKEYLRNLIPYLQNQSEDCLHLNIYSPKNDEYINRKLPIMVYIHGESYEWNSGNPYDGSVLASFANVIVVTINYRLGVLGFMRMGLSEQAGSNFGLKDQIAALLWLQENIAAFGGDPNSITLIGHSTGAVLTSFLTLSPVSAAQNLFHRAILMSGSALSDWALGNPDLITMQIAMQLNCPINEDELAACMRKKRLNDILDVANNLYSSEFRTRFGPVIDGSVIPNDPNVLMEIYNSIFSRYDLIYGVTEMESFQLFNDIVLVHGMLASEAKAILRAFLEAKFRFEYKWEPALASILNEYDHSLRTSSTIENRNVVLDVLSDARVLAPLVQTGSYHCAVNTKSYFYVFGHVTQSRDYNARNLSAYSDELPYVFGVPLDSPRFQIRNYFTADERILSEQIINYFANFAYYGNPNDIKTKYGGKRSGSAAGAAYWPKFNNVNQTYLYLDVKDSVRKEYREHYVKFWNKILPEVLKNQVNSLASIKTGAETKKPKNIPFWMMTSDLNDFNSQGHGQGQGPGQQYELDKKSFEFEMRKIAELEAIGIAGEDEDTHLLDNSGKELPATPETSPQPPPLLTTTAMADSWTLLNIVIVLAIVLFTINLIVFAILHSKRKSLKCRERDLERIYETTAASTYFGTMRPQSYCAVDADEGLVIQQQQQHNPNNTNTLNQHIGTDVTLNPASNVIRMFTKTFKGDADNNTNPNNKTNRLYESVNLRQLTTNTKNPMAPHTSPITRWMMLMNGGNSDERPRPQPSTATQTLMRRGTANKQVLQQQQQPSSHFQTLPSTAKISVAVDATPSGRGNSVLRQEPIELTKIKRCATFDTIVQIHEKPRSVHVHSKSEPVERRRETEEIVLRENNNEPKRPVLPVHSTPKPSRSLSLPKPKPKPPPRSSNQQQQQQPHQQQQKQAKKPLRSTTVAMTQTVPEPEPEPVEQPQPIYDNLPREPNPVTVSGNGLKTIICAGNKSTNESATVKREPKIIVKAKKVTLQQQMVTPSHKTNVRVRLPAADDHLKMQVLENLHSSNTTATPSSENT